MDASTLVKIIAETTAPSIAPKIVQIISTYLKAFPKRKINNGDLQTILMSIMAENSAHLNHQLDGLCKQFQEHDEKTLNEIKQLHAGIISNYAEIIRRL